MTAEEAAAEYASRAVNSPVSPWSVDGLAAAFLAGAAWAFEEAAKVADGSAIGIRDERWDKGYNRACEVIASAIRARGRAEQREGGP